MTNRLVQLEYDYISDNSNNNNNMMDNLTNDSSENVTHSGVDLVKEEWDWPWGEEAPFHFPLIFHVAAHILYNLVLVLGLIGNGCVLLIFSMTKVPFRKLPTPLLANLALGDLLITIFCLETGYLSLLWQYWPFGKFLCFALSPVKPIAVFVSCYTLIALSVDRYLGVKDPLKTGLLSKEKVRWTIGIIWVLAIGTSLPTGVFTSYEVHLLTGKPRCGEYAWESEIKEMIYDLTLITLQFFAPVFVLIYTYTKISIVVCRNKAIRHRMSQGTSPRHKSLRTIRMSLIVVLGYTFAWLPYNVVSLLAKYHPSVGDSDHFPYIFVFCHWLAMSHSVFNPVIYFWLNDSFRRSVLELFCKHKVRLSDMRKMSSWRSTIYTTTNGGRASTISRTSARLKSTPSPIVTDINPFTYPGTTTTTAPLLKVTESYDKRKEEESILINGDENFDGNQEKEQTQQLTANLEVRERTLLKDDPLF